MSIRVEGLEKKNIYEVLSSKGIPASDIYLMIQDLIDEEKEDKWFTPEPGSPVFNSCGRLFNLNVIARMKIPVYKDTRFKKWKFRFLYNLNLEF